MARLLRPLLFLAVFLAVPIVPFLFLGEQFERRVERWFAADASAERVSAGLQMAFVAGALAGDIFLPIPSSAVSTWAGAALGTARAAAASWVGMTAGAVFGFGLARLFGDRFARRRADSRDLEQMARLSRKFGPLALVLTRALPILAEACVLLMGASRLSWRRFLIPVAASNLVIALVYSAFGEYFRGRDALPVAIVASGAVPLLAALLIRRRLPSLDLKDDAAT